jgi:hypothetical protein
MGAKSKELKNMRGKIPDFKIEGVKFRLDVCVKKTYKLIHRELTEIKIAKARFNGDEFFCK